MDYISVAKAAEKFGVSQRRVQVLCEQGRIEGAEMVGGVWRIPHSAAKPEDARRKGAIAKGRTPLYDTIDNMNNKISLPEACSILSISEATGRNWVRLGKLKPIAGYAALTFYKSDVIKLSASIQNSNTSVLKSRRNKKKISGISVYKDYIGSSENAGVIEEIVNNGGLVIDETQLRIILCNFALQLLFQKEGRQFHSNNLVEAYITGEISAGRFSPLFDDLLGEIADGWIADPISPVYEVLNKRVNYIKGEDTLGFAYLSLRSIGHRKATGAYFTPVQTVKALADTLADCIDMQEKTIFDPCCGTGNFLIYISSFTAKPEQLFGQDIDEISVQLARLNIVLNCSVKDIALLYKNFTCGNTLVSEMDARFDVIIGNPPWGYEFSAEEVSCLVDRYKTASKKGIESYDLFIERSLALINPGGSLAFVLPEAVLNVKSHQAVRNILLQTCSFQFVSYVGNVFSGVQCPAILLGVRLDGKGATEGCKVRTADREFVIGTNRKLSHEGFTFTVSDEEQECLDSMEVVPHKAFLAGQAQFALGIVTGDNKKFIKDTESDGYEVILKGSDVQRYRIIPGNNYILFNPEAYQQTAPIELYRAPEKLLYRFICESLVFAYDDSQTLSLNSCNILIPQIPGLNIKYVLAILNSRAAAFYCMKKFNSVKVLRSHIEQIPIPVVSESGQVDIIKETERILNCKDSIIGLYDELDSKIMELYGMTSAQQEIIRTALKGRNLFLP
jgi:predicted site-specific integrase-resolvase/SAM-dependent methyltransferase